MPGQANPCLTCLRKHRGKYLKTLLRLFVLFFVMVHSSIQMISHHIIVLIMSYSLQLKFRSWCIQSWIQASEMGIYKILETWALENNQDAMSWTPFPTPYHSKPAWPNTQLQYSFSPSASPHYTNLQLSKIQITWSFTQTSRSLA